MQHIIKINDYLFNLIEGRKKGKDKSLPKKKRDASSEDEIRGASGNTTTQKSNKKVKVNQGKESRKGQKVRLYFHFYENSWRDYFHTTEHCNLNL